MCISLEKISRLAVVCCAVMTTTGCHPAAQVRSTVDESYRDEIEQWRAHRVRRLKGELGWLRLAGLFWLKPGTNHMGSDPSSDITLPSRAAPTLATLRLEGQDVYLSVTKGVNAKFRDKPVSEMLLLSDREGKREPDMITAGDFTFFIIDRGGRKALRLFDRQAKTLKSFKGIEYFPIDTKWRIEGKFVPFSRARTVQVNTAIGTTVEEKIQGEVRFTVGSESYSLQPSSEQGSDKLFFVFADATSGKQTYGGGRFLVATKDAQGHVVMDFNKAYNPPCAFTSFATCPLPRVENRLALEITAGEKIYKHDQDNTVEHW